MITCRPFSPLTTPKVRGSRGFFESTAIDYELNPLLMAALDKHEFPPVLDAAATKAACEHDILLDENLMAHSVPMTLHSRILELSSHRRLCEEVLAAANHAIHENHRLALSAGTMAKLVAVFILQDK